jgi:hypothetical protein
MRFFARFPSTAGIPEDSFPVRSGEVQRIDEAISGDGGGKWVGGESEQAGKGNPGESKRRNGAVSRVHSNRSDGSLLRYVRVIPFVNAGP